MDPSQKKAKEREFFDVHPGVRQGSRPAIFKRFFGRNTHTVNLQQNRFRRHARRLIPVGTALVGFLLAIVSFNLFTRAEFKDFYPEVCLGAWENAAGAAGQPESFEPILAAEGFSNENSAIYRLPGTEVFCGGFLAPSEETEGNITNVALTFIWRVGERPSLDEPVGVVETPPTVPAESSDATDTPSEPSDSAPAEGTTDAPAVPEDAAPVSEPAPVPEPAPEPTPSEPTARSGQSFFSFVVSRARAQETTEPVTNPEPPVTAPESVPEIPAPIPEPASEAPAQSPGESIILPPLTTELLPLGDETAPDEPVGPLPTYEPLPPPPPDENFLKVSYSVDGESWFEIGKVNMDNWQNFTARLPISQWDEVKNLQISVEGIPTTLNPVPPVYLAGMFIGVNYELPPFFGDEDELLDESSDGLPILDAPNAIRAALERGDENVFGAGERVEFDIDLSVLPSLNGTSTEPSLDEPENTTTTPSEIPAPPVEPDDVLPDEPPPTPATSTPPLAEPIPEPLPAPTSTTETPIVEPPPTGSSSTAPIEITETIPTPNATTTGE